MKAYISLSLLLSASVLVAQPADYKWCFDVQDELVFSPVIGTDGTIYVNAASRLWAITPPLSATSDATKKFVRPFIHNLQGSPVLSPQNDTLYVALQGDDKSVHSQITAVNLLSEQGTENNWEVKEYASNAISSAPLIEPTTGALLVNFLSWYPNPYHDGAPRYQNPQHSVMWINSKLGTPHYSTLVANLKTKKDIDVVNVVTNFMQRQSEPVADGQGGIIIVKRFYSWKNVEQLANYRLTSTDTLRTSLYWTTKAVSGALSSPVVNKIRQRVYVLEFIPGIETDELWLHAYNTNQRGTIVPSASVKVEIPPHVTSPLDFVIAPTVTDTEPVTIYVGSQRTGFVYSFSDNDIALTSNWKQNINPKGIVNIINKPLVIDAKNNLVYVVNNRGTLYALTTDKDSQGSINWQSDDTETFITAPVLAKDGTIIIGRAPTYVQALTGGRQDS